MANEVIERSEDEMDDYDSKRLISTLGRLIAHKHWRAVSNVSAELAKRFPKNVRASSIADKYIAPVAA